MRRLRANAKAASIEARSRRSNLLMQEVRSQHSTAIKRFPLARISRSSTNFNAAIVDAVAALAEAYAMLAEWTSKVGGVCTLFCKRQIGARRFPLARRSPGVAVIAQPFTL